MRPSTQAAPIAALAPQVVRDAAEMETALAMVRKTYGVSAQVAGERLAAAIRQSMGDGRHWSTHPDTINAPADPRAAHGPARRPGGLAQAAVSTLNGGPHHPVLPHSGEQEPPVSSDEATPEQRRDAWLRLVSSFEGHLLGVREGARQRLADVKAWRADGCTTEQMEAAIPEWDATIWAADRLLSQLVALQAPEVPVDHARGQGSILELVPDPPSTVVEEPVDQRTWWQDDQGHQRHGEEDLGPWGNGHGSL